MSRRRVHLPEHDRTKPARQVVTFLLIANIAMFAIYTFEAQKVFANPVSQIGMQSVLKSCIINRIIHFWLTGSTGFLRLYCLGIDQTRHTPVVYFPSIPQCSHTS